MAIGVVGVMTGTDIWFLLSLTLYGVINYAAYRASLRKRDSDDSPPFIGLATCLVVPGPMFTLSAPAPIAAVGGGVLFFGSIIFVFYCWASGPSNIRKRDEAVEQRRRNLQAANEDARRQTWEARQQAELSQKQAAFNAITVDRNGVTNIAKHVVEELARANS